MQVRFRQTPRRPVSPGINPMILTGTDPYAGGLPAGVLSAFEASGYTGTTWNPLVGPYALVNGHGTTPVAVSQPDGTPGVWFAGNGALDFPGPGTTTPFNSRAFSVALVGELQALPNGPGGPVRASLLSTGIGAGAPFLLSDAGSSGTGTGIWTATTAGSGSLSGSKPIPTSRCVLTASGSVPNLILGVNESQETLSPLAAHTDFLRALGGYFVANYTFVRIFGLYYWTRALLPAELTQLRTYLYSRFAVQPAPTRRVFFVGDSITQGSVSTNGLNYPRQLAIPTSYQQWNYGVAGTKTTDWTNTLLDNTVGQAIQANDIVCLNLGTNDLDASTTPATVLANLQAIVTYCRGKASGVKVLVGTVIDRNGSANAGFDTDRATLNTAILADSGNLALDGVMDFYSDARLENAANVTYFGGDQIHPVNAGYLVMAGIATPVILAV